ncbi:MAG TPA: hypothetical protein VHP36_05345 [Chitinispirillaceae bacterium]|nr:hypothetical protein [Chitinispirillaceae bacterium]
MDCPEDLLAEEVIFSMDGYVKKIMIDQTTDSLPKLRKIISMIENWGNTLKK